jgi:hypothetical protein
MSSNQIKIDKKILQLKRLIFADQSMQTVMEGCARAVASTLDENEKMIFSAGIATLYASPFTSGNGLGALEKEFSEFEDKNLEEHHQTLMTCRHGLFSHRDMRIKGTNSKGTALTLHQLFVVVDSEGKHFIDSTRPKWAASVFPKVKKLAEFQHLRLCEKADLIYSEVASRTSRPPGRYALG